MNGVQCGREIRHLVRSTCQARELGSEFNAKGFAVSFEAFGEWMDANGEIKSFNGENVGLVAGGIISTNSDDRYWRTDGSSIGVIAWPVGDRAQ